MSEKLDIRATERGIVRLFAIDLPPEKIAAFDATEALGVDRLVPEHVEIVDLADLRGLGLAGYMHEGLGIARADLDAARLDALTGHVLILRSAAFGGQALTVTSRAPLRWIGTYAEESAPVTFAPLPTGGTQGEMVPKGGKSPSDTAISGRVAMVALIVIFALTALMVWIA